MAAAAILKIGLMAISRSLWHIFERNFTQTQTLYWCVVFFLFNCMLVLFSHFGYNEINDWYFFVLLLERGYLEGALDRDRSSGSRGGGSR